MMASYNNYTISSGCAYEQSPGSAINVFAEPVILNYSSPNDETSDGKYYIYDIADWFLFKRQMSLRKLQKLCYYAQAWNYALKNKRLINADFKADVDGPVSPVLEEKFKSFENFDIVISGKNKEIDEEDIKLLEDVLFTYGDKSENALCALSEREDPWIAARNGYAEDERCSVSISPECMREYYRGIYKK